MTLRLNDKKEIVAQVNSVAKEAVSVVAAEYRGISSGAMTELRANARNAKVQLRVVRNTLARIAFKDTDYESLSESLVGPVLLAFSAEEPGASARLLQDFAKSNDKLAVKVISLQGKLYDSSQLAAIAKLPTKDEALSKLLSVMQAPIAKFVATLAAPHTKLVRTLVAVREAKTN